MRLPDAFTQTRLYNHLQAAARMFAMCIYTVPHASGVSKLRL